MGNQLIYRNIYKKIKKYDTIVIVRHVGADPDALASQIALRDVILNTFPKKRVYAVGNPASAFKYLGILDKFNEEMYQNSLLISLDVPDAGRVDGVDVRLFKDSIKIDHHPFVEKYCNLEWVDDSASSTCQMIMELILNTRLKITKSAAEKHAAQLEKWVSQYFEENEVSPKGVLIVNGFCDTPLNERLEDVFPQQMLKYCVARGHVLLTSTQLLCLYIELCNNPACKEERITELLSCVGKYERYRETKDYLK